MNKQELISILQKVAGRIPPGNANEGQFRSANALALQLITRAEGADSLFVEELINIKNEEFWGSHFKADCLVQVINSYIDYASIPSHTFRQEAQEKIFVNLERLGELAVLTSEKYDLRRLIRLLEELNATYSMGCYLSVGMLVRSIIDHVPPIFGKNIFSEVANNHGGKSFRDAMGHLESSLRKIADSFLHSQIRRKESLPNETQINFSQALDVLLAEICRVIQNSEVLD